MKYSWGEPTIKTPWFQCAFPNHPLMPRDVLGIYGNTILEMFTGSSGRFFENLAYHNISQHYYENGYRWVSMPMPLMESKNISYPNSNQVFYHAANIIKCGKDLFYSLNGTNHKAGKGTEAGINWIKTELGDNFRWNKVDTHGHCDGKVALLRPGVAMTWNKDWIPEKMKDWTIIEADSDTELPDDFNKMRKKRFYKDFIEEYLEHWIGYVDETVFDVNVLSIDESHVICTGKNKKVFDQLESLGIEPIYWNFRHQYFWDGGVHCVTQDVVREGKQEDYFE